MKAQSAVEYAATLVVVLIAMIPIIYLAMQNIENAHRTALARAAVDTMVEAANLVYANGVGARTTVDVTLPPAIDPNTPRVSGREIRLRVFMSNGVGQDTFGLARGNLTGTIPVTQGQHRLRFDMLANGTVQISEPT